MKQILIFAGTTEGRVLAERLCSLQMPCTVCVATQYGGQVMGERPGITVRTGRMGPEEMRRFIREGDYAAVVDATHPYATLVSKHIRGSIQGLSMPYLRLKRDTDMAGIIEEKPDRLLYFDSHEACAAYLAGTKGNILLTTGSRELAVYTGAVSRSRLFVRVIPSIESLQACNACEIIGRQIIAMQGPFSSEMNRALIAQFHIRYLVTKESGTTGGFGEKVEAACAAGIPALVIGNPEQSGGVSLEEAVNRLLEWTGVQKTQDDSGTSEKAAGAAQEEAGQMGREEDGRAMPEEAERKTPEETEGKTPEVMEWNRKWNRVGPEKAESPLHQIALLGMGMGDRRLLTGEVQEKLEQAEVLFGAKRLLHESAAWIHPEEAKPYYLAEDILPWLQAQECGRKVAVLFSGDTGFYSGAGKLYRALQQAVEQGELRASVKLYPGICAVSYLAASLGVSWEDAAVESIHGREINLPGLLQKHARTFLLLSGREDVNRIGKIMLENHLQEAKVYLGFQLSYPEEQIRCLTPQECMQITQKGLYCCMIYNERAAQHVLTPGISDRLFTRDRVPMTKEEIRILSVCKLRLTQESVLYDIGSGTGSVSMECARLSEKIRVYAIDCNPAAIELTAGNAVKQGLCNIQTVHGDARDAIQKLPSPTHAFIGGSGGGLGEILKLLYRKNPAMRVVVNAVSLETIAELTALLPKLSLREREIIQVQIARENSAGRYHLMKAENPVYIAAFCFDHKKEEDTQADEQTGIREESHSK